jgi:hypothetical protein
VPYDFETKDIFPRSTAPSGGGHLNDRFSFFFLPTNDLVPLFGCFSFFPFSSKLKGEREKMNLCETTKCVKKIKKNHVRFFSTGCFWI